MLNVDALKQAMVNRLNVNLAGDGAGGRLNARIACGERIVFVLGKQLAV